MQDNFKVTCRLTQGHAGCYDIAAWHRTEREDGSCTEWVCLALKRVFIDPSVYNNRQLLGRLARSLVSP
jgi:hypothetical protein